MNRQQLAFLRVVVDRDDELRSVEELLDKAEATSQVSELSEMSTEGYPLRPGTGKAFELRADETLRITQIGGGQCVDLNIFNLANPRERLHVGRTRGMQGPHPTTGDVLWSNAPWERPIAEIVASTTRTDTYFPYCSPLIYRELFGLEQHTNCLEIQNEAQREYGLAPWQIHESLNLFMYTDVADGEPAIRPNRSRPGDHIEFRALLDLLVVPNVCGDDLTDCSNYGVRPVTVDRMPRSPEWPATFPHLDGLLPAGLDVDPASVLPWAIDRLGVFRRTS